MTELDIITAVTKVDHPYLMEFEKSFDSAPYKEWMLENWTVSFYIGIVYVIGIFALQHYMSSRERMDLRSLLGIWSAVLAIFSIIGTLRTVLEMYTSINVHGFHYSICNPGFYKGPSGFWVMLYTLSKAYELGDTLFIVLRKQKLIFLHWYHHLATLIYMFFAYKDFISLGRWGVTMNFVVHSFMYTYYALKAFQIKVPRAVNLMITSIQIMQMIVGVTLTTYAFVLINDGTPCGLTLENNVASCLMYISYFILFANFFHKTYVTKKAKTT